MKDVYINRLATFLPFDPISNDEMEDRLGLINGKKSKVRSIILRSNGIKTRYYAFKEGQKTFSNAGLTAKAIQALFPDNNELNNIELLACGTSSPDQFLPSHAAMVHGELGIDPTEIYSFAGSCNTSMQAFKTAYLNIACEQVGNAVVTGSERMSQFMLAENFQEEIDKVQAIEENGYIAFEKDFLRWMLSDGAAAAYLNHQPNANQISLKIDWIEITSYAGKLETCMYAGAEKEGAELVGFNDIPRNEWMSKSIFSFKQDTRLLSEHIVQRGMDFLKEVTAKKSFNIDTIDWFLPHLSSQFFQEKIKEQLAYNQMDIPYEKWFTNLTKIGNVGSASPLFMLAELMESKRLMKGQKILLMVPESARFAYTYALLTVV